jgi:glycine/D-amino acid oxidase-like deaminating enzyme
VGLGRLGRNGGFCSASHTHGAANGQDRFPSELATLERMGRENLDGIEKAVVEHGIDCSFERTGELTVGDRALAGDDLRELPALGESVGSRLEWLDADDGARQGRLAHLPRRGAGPRRRGHGWTPRGSPAVCARPACGSASGSTRTRRCTALERSAAGVVLRTAYGRVTARRVALGTNAFRPLLRRMSSYLVPVWDYALMSEPLTAEQRAAVGWADRHGMADAGNLFHYYRVTDDWRILWGGYDAVYHFGGRTDDRLERNPATFLRLAEHFQATFPQLEGLRFTHAWGGIIDTCSRFSAFWGTAHSGAVAYAAGYTGLGVGATRFGGQVLLDLLEGADTERTALEMVRRKPVPFPPEPLRWAGVELTRRGVAKADANGGRRGPWLRTLDAVGLGFDS